MKTYDSHEYDDIDGNRGIDVTFYELDDNDRDDVIMSLKERLDGDYEDYKGTRQIVFLLAPNGYSDVEFEIDFDDYITCKADWHQDVEPLDNHMSWAISKLFKKTA